MRFTVGTIVTALILARIGVFANAIEENNSDVAARDSQELTERDILDIDFEDVAARDGPAPPGPGPAPSKPAPGPGRSRRRNSGRHERTVAAITAAGDLAGQLGSAAITGAMSRPRDYYDDLDIWARAPRGARVNRHERTVAAIGAAGDMIGQLGSAAITGAFSRGSAPRSYYDDWYLEARDVPKPGQQPRRRRSSGRHERTVAAITAAGDLAGQLGSAAITGAFNRRAAPRSYYDDWDFETRDVPKPGQQPGRRRNSGRHERTVAAITAAGDLAGQLGSAAITGAFNRGAPRSYYDEWDLDARDYDDWDFEARDVPKLGQQPGRRRSSGRHERTVAAIGAAGDMIGQLGSAAITGAFNRGAPRSYYDNWDLDARDYDDWDFEARDVPKPGQQPGHRRNSGRHERTVAAITAAGDLAGQLGSAAITGAFNRGAAPRSYYDDWELEARAPRRRHNGPAHERTTAAIAAAGDLVGQLGSAAITGAFNRARDYSDALEILEARRGRRTAAAKSAAGEAATQLGTALVFGGLGRLVSGQAAQAQSQQQQPRALFDEWDLETRSETEGAEVEQRAESSDATEAVSA